METVAQLFLSGIMSGSVYALTALGIVLIFKSTGVFNFGHGSVIAFMCFFVWSTLAQFNAPLWLAVILLFVAAIVIGMTIERLILRPLTGQPILAIVLVTLVLGELFTGIIILFWPGPGRVFPPIIPSGKVALGNVIASYENLIIFGLCMLAFALLVLFFQRTNIGLAMRATAEDHQLGRSQGVKTSITFAMAWIIAIVTGAIAGVLLGNLHGVNMESIAEVGMRAFPVALLGGLESIYGCIVGGLIIGVVEIFAASYLDPLVNGGLEQVFPFIILLLVIMVRPYGLFGYVKIERV